MEENFNIRDELRGLVFLSRNMLATSLLSLASIPQKNAREFTIEGLPQDKVEDLKSIHMNLRNGRQINFWRYSLLYFHADKICSIITCNKQNIVGFQLLYFRKNEWRKNIIHEAFIGISPEFRGMGLSTQLRKHTVEHLKRNKKLCGISSQVSRTDTTAIRSARKAGFMVLAETENTGRNSDSVFPLYCDLEKKRQAKAQ